MKQGVIWILMTVLVISGCAIAPQTEEEQEENRLNVNEPEWNTLGPSDKAAAIGGYN